MARHRKPGGKPGKADAPPAVAVHDLSLLGALRDQLSQRAAAEARAEARRREAAAQAAADADLFRRSIGTVTPLRAEEHVVTSPPRPLPVPLHTRRDEAQVMRDALSDAYDPDMMLDSDDSISFRRNGIGFDVVRRLRRGEWVVQAQLDLHGLRREEAREALSSFIHEAGKQHLRCLRVIHGKGLGSANREPVLKGKVRSWLTQKNEVLAFAETRDRDGGAGAVLVLLQPTRTRC
ncbi:Smr/MutS family protein [Chitinasiproducens palmae]|uniref:DNA-nicking endonuclease, Smr domain n=1 Tax=Chitinasiproducens palmae TaxID=1770053 RepID=A0A1H2PMX2_9BURK|nr:Smr/MutS family protein [Chitinasiproducens palmae]SDV47960.1 DNA-nicking endonuclease, Smr domain [Chitinasiproducens palmae]